MKRTTLSALTAATLLAGCSLAPDYLRPDPPVSASWPTGPAYSAPPPPAAGAANPVASAEATGWRDFFTDPQLQALIEIALNNNRDLRIAALNVAAAEAQYRVQRSDLFPKLGFAGTGNVDGLPTNNSSNPSATLYGQKGGTTHLYAINGGFTSYELDLFGRVRSLSTQAFEQYLGYDETRRSTQISLVAQVANAYLALLADRELLGVTKETLDSQTNSYALTQAMFKQGTATQLALREAETSVDTARANLALYTRQVAQDENALTQLIGQPIPPSLPAGRGLDDQHLLADLPEGLPSDLLTNRPDIMAAEHNLKAANANIGAARAAFFPSISLTASGGVQSTNLGSLFTGGAATWSFAPQITVPIFTAGQNQANLDLAKVQTNIYVAQYEKTIQTAFREVSDGLAARGTYVDQVAAQQCAGRGLCRQLPPGRYAVSRRGGQLPVDAGFAAFTVPLRAGPDRDEAGQARQPGHAVQGAGRRLERAQHAAFVIPGAGSPLIDAAILLQAFVLASNFIHSDDSI